MIAEAQSDWMPLAQLIVGGIVTLGMAWFALQQAKLARKVDEVEKNTNSMREAMVISAKKEGHAEGVLEQKDKNVVTDSMKEVLAAVTGLKGQTTAPVFQEMPAVKSLVNIDTNTARTEESTARTEAAVDELKDKAK